MLVELVEKERAAKINKEYLNLYAQDPEKYKTKIDKEESQPVEAADLTITNDDERLYIIRDQGLLLGYIKGEVTPASEEIPVPNAPGYNNYQHRESSFTIDRIEMFEQGRGIGSYAIKALQEEPFELIDLEAKGEELKQFYHKRGFIDSTLREGKHNLLVWNNPSYQN